MFSYSNKMFHILSKFYHILNKYSNILIFTSKLTSIRRLKDSVYGI